METIYCKYHFCKCSALPQESKQSKHVSGLKMPVWVLSHSEGPAPAELEKGQTEMLAMPLAGIVMDDDCCAVHNDL
eukprot:880910-Pelagomonas_calceolata.AAC.2